MASSHRTFWSRVESSQSVAYNSLSTGKVLEQNRKNLHSRASWVELGRQQLEENQLRSEIISGERTVMFQYLTSLRHWRSRRGALRSKFILRRSRFLKVWVLKDPPTHISEYYSLVVSGLLEDSSSKGSFKQIAVCFPKDAALLPKKIRKVVLQLEHTILSSYHAQDNYVASPLKGGTQFLVRLLGPIAGFKASSSIIEYSRSNIAHIEESSFSELYRAKVVYIAPLLGLASGGVEISPRETPTVHTMFGSPDLGRRKELVEELRRKGLKIENLREYRDLSQAFSRVGILLNIRQFSHFHTLEELRVLPAILNGVIVVTEPSERLEQVPYRNFLISAPVEEWPKLIPRLQNSYWAVWDKMFSGNRLDQLARQLRLDNSKGFKRILTLAS